MNLRVSTSLLSFFILITVFSSSIYGNEVFFDRTTESDQKIRGLNWSDNPPKLLVKRMRSGKDQFFAKLEGKYDEPQSTLILNLEKKIKIKNNGHFSITLPLYSTTSEANLTAISPLGGVYKETIRIEFPKFKLLKKKKDDIVKKESDQGGFYGDAGLSITVIEYKQKLKTDPVLIKHVQDGLTGKVSLGYRFKDSPWSLGGNSFLTLFPIKKNTSSTPRFLGINIRGGYTTNWLPHDWKLSLLFGYYYTTTIVSPPDFGFKGLRGVQIFPYVRKYFENGDAASLYFKYVPLHESAIVSFSTTDREIGFGLSYIFYAFSEHPWSIGFDAIWLRREFGSRANFVVHKLVSFGLSYGF